MSAYEHAAGVWHTSAPTRLRVRNLLDGDGRIVVQMCERDDSTWGVWDGRRWIVDRVTVEEAWRAASAARWRAPDDIPVVSPGLRRLVFGTLWTLTVAAFVAWRIGDGLPLVDGIFVGIGLASWPWLVAWLIRQHAEDELDVIDRAWGRR